MLEIVEDLRSNFIKKVEGTMNDFTGIQVGIKL